MDEDRTAHKVLISTLNGKISLSRPRRRWKDNIRMDLNEIGYEGRERKDLAQGWEYQRDLIFAALSF